MQIAFYIIVALTIISFIIVGVFDDITATIPHTITIILLVLGILSIIFDQSSDKVWWLPLTIALVVFLFQFVLFIIMGENAIGGGDVKIMAICCLFIHSLERLYVWALAFGAASLIALILGLFKKNKLTRMGKWLGFSVIPLFFLNFNITIEMLCIYLFVIYAIDNIVERRIPDDTIFSQDFKKQERK